VTVPVAEAPSRTDDGSTDKAETVAADAGVDNRSGTAATQAVTRTARRLTLEPPMRTATTRCSGTATSSHTHAKAAGFDGRAM
jgi:hypothetical protein